jgi:hypothetical protein
MRRKLKNLKHKSGHSENGSPRQLIDEAVYREHRNHVNAYLFSNPPAAPPQWDPQYSGWSNASRPRDHAIFLRSFAPAAAPAPSIDLGTAANYAILAKSTVTNVATSSVEGNIGLSPAAASAPNTGITGFNTTLDGSGEFLTSAQVIGDLYAANLSPPTPANLTTAVADMEAAYTAASTAAPTHPVNFEGGILGGQTLTPGVWKWTSNVTIDGNLTLDGPGTYILQIAGTMELGASGPAEILLTGGATPGDVFWAVAGANTIHAGSAFVGELLAQTSIALQAGATVEGRLLAQTQVTLIQNTIDEA